MLGNSKAYPTIAVKDAEEAKKFYGDVLGLKLVNEMEGGLTFLSGGGNIFVYPSEYAGTNKATYAGWSVSDLESVVADLKSKGVEFEHYPDMEGATMEGDLHSYGDDFKIAWFKDPTGNILSIDNMDSQQG